MTKSINLALQGGGAHGAFTWGVLDVLIADETLRIDGITGTSAGAMNAAVLITGIMQGGRQRAREALCAFWRDVSEAARLSPIQRSIFDRLMGNWSLDMSPGYLAFDIGSRVVSPALTNPLNLNPLREIVEAHVDVDAIHDCRTHRLFVAATNVTTGKARIFNNRAISIDALMASACIPQLFVPIIIDGEPYWDGGFIGNPPLYPLFYETDTPDTVIVQINPILRREVPYSAREIVNRVNEITFNSALLKELRAVRFVTRLIEEGKLDRNEYMRVYMHRIASSDLNPLSASSKLNAEWAFLDHLKGIGETTATAWRQRHYDDLGVRDTIDIAADID